MLEWANVEYTYCCNPLKIKQNFINFDISSNYKVIWIEIISWKYLWNLVNSKWKLIIVFDSFKNKLEIIFDKWKKSYEYINNDNNYDEDNIIFWNISINFNNNNEILSIVFKNASLILDIDKFLLNNKWLQL